MLVFLFSFYEIKKSQLYFYPAFIVKKKKKKSSEKYILLRVQQIPKERQVLIKDATGIWMLITSFFFYSHKRDRGSGYLNYSLNIPSHSR